MDGAHSLRGLGTEEETQVVRMQFGEAALHVPHPVLRSVAGKLGDVLLQVLDLLDVLGQGLCAKN